METHLHQLNQRFQKQYKQKLVQLIRKETEKTITSTVTSEPGKTTGLTEYQLATKYTLKRADGSVVSDPWVVKNNKITVARKI